MIFDLLDNNSNRKANHKGGKVFIAKLFFSSLSLLWLKRSPRLTYYIVVVLITLFTVNPALAQEPKIWSLAECTQYAVENSPKTKIRHYSDQNLKHDKTTAIASLFPSIGGSVGVQANFGRTIDPETNIYSNSSNFSNSYQLSATLPLFNAGRLINNIKLAKVAQLRGLSETQRITDELTLTTMQAFTDVIYYTKLIDFCENKLEESRQLLHKTKKMEEQGTKSMADVALSEAQVAQDEYNLIHADNQLNLAMVNLKGCMNYPIEDLLTIDTVMENLIPVNQKETSTAVFAIASESNPLAIIANYQVEMAKISKNMALSYLFPNIYFYTGINTYYNKIASSNIIYPNFQDQFVNNMGEWVGVGLEIPIFNGLRYQMQYKKEKNNLLIAGQERVETMHQLRTEIEQAVRDRDGLEKEIMQMERQVNAHEIAYRATLRKYDLGMQSIQDLQVSANTLLQARANQLQVELNYFLKCKLVEYYMAINN